MEEARPWYPTGRCFQFGSNAFSGCNVEVGDIYASGTISGSDPKSFGSLLELTWRGQNPLILEDGQQRSFLEDGDTVIMKGFAQNASFRVGFGEVRTTILPSL